MGLRISGGTARHEQFLAAKPAFGGFPFQPAKAEAKDLNLH
jgi:hypothetical protein